jgi:hypothetical protein
MMLATSGAPESRVDAEPIHQVCVTHCLFGEGLYRQAGFTIRACSTRDQLILRFALEYPPYEVPAGLNDTSPEPADLPRRLALVRLPGGNSALIHSSYVPVDERGRPNNFFSHVLVRSTLTPLEALATWASPDWGSSCPEAAGTDLPPLADLPQPGPVNDEAVTAFLKPTITAEDQDLATLTCPQRLVGAPRRRRELVAMALRGCLLALQAGPGSQRGRFVLLAEPGLVALLLYAAVRLLPERLAANLTFSTYENAHRDLRSFRHAQVVGTYTADPQKGLEEEFFTTRGYALDTFNQKFSPELDASEELAVEEWVEVAARGEWAVIDKVQRLQGETHGSIVAFHEALQAAKLAGRVASGKMEAADLLALKHSPRGPALLEQQRDKVWPLIRDSSLANARVREEFADTLREHLDELEQATAQTLRAQTPENWLPHWRLLCSLLMDDPGRLRATVQRILPEPPYTAALRFALLRELHSLQLSPVDQRPTGHGLLRSCSAAELDQFAQSDLPREWFVWALCYAIANRETRAEAVRHLHGGSDELLASFCAQLRLLRDEDRRRAILAPVFPPSDPQRLPFFGRLLKQRGALPPETLEWLLEWLGALGREFADFWCQEDHLGQLLEMVAEGGAGAARILDRLCGRINHEALLSGNLYQQTLLTNLAAARDRPGTVIPPQTAQVITDWTMLREHFEKAAAVPDDARPAIIDACNRRGLNPMDILPGYFARFIQPQGMSKEVLDDFAGFYHSFCPAGTEHQDYSSRLIGWLQIVATCKDEASMASYQQYYLEQYVPVAFRWRVAEEMQQSGKLLRAVYDAVPKLTTPGQATVVADHAAHAGAGAALFQLSGIPFGAGQPPPLPLASAWKRLPWLMCSLGGGILAAYVSGLHRAGLQHVAGLAMYVPVVLVLAESMAVQSAALALATGHQKLTRRALGRVLGKELLAGLLLGLVLGFVVGVITALMGWPWRFAVCLAVTAIGGSACAAGVGFGLPALLSLSRWGSRVAAGPVTRALAGVLALFLYFNLARWLLR